MTKGGKPSIRIGWREWVALPALGLPAIKAKVDTGANTSALHAFKVEPFTKAGRPYVSFRVFPSLSKSRLARGEVVSTCEAPVVDYRAVSDSGGHREMRFVIETELRMGELSYLIEITLANRESMSHRMLIGRSAMRNLLIDPEHSFLLGKPKLGPGAQARKKTRKKE